MRTYILSVLIFTGLSTALHAAAPMAGPGNCLTFDGTGECVVLNGLTDLSGSELTIEYWFKGSSLSWPLSQYVSSSSYLTACYLSKAFFYRSKQVVVDPSIPGTNAQDGKWHHLAWSYKTGETDGIFSTFDGTIIDRATGTDTVINVGTDLLIGRQTRAGQINFSVNGMMDEVRVWSVARTADEIRRNRYRALTGDEPGLVAWYRFNAAAGTTLADRSVNGWDGTTYQMEEEDWTASSIYDSVIVYEDDTLYLAAGTDPDGDSLTITVLSGAAGGTVLTDNAACEVIYVPDGDFNGPDSFTYAVTDPGGAADTVQVGVFVLPVNDAPSFITGSDGTVPEDTGAVTVAGWADTGSIVPGPANESAQNITFDISTTNDALFTVLPAVDGITGDLTYTPADNAWGTALVYIRAYDDGGTNMGGTDSSALDSFVITVSRKSDDPPTASPGSPVCSEDDTVLFSTGSDIDGDPFTITILDAPVYGTADSAGEDIVYIPGTDWFGTDSLRYAITDTTGLADTAWVLIAVTAVNDAPYFTSIAADTCYRLEPYYYESAAMDIDGDPLTYSYTGYPAWLTAIDYVIFGTPPDSALTDTVFTVIVSDSKLADTLTVQLAILNGDAKVPVQLSSFTAGERDGDILLEWTTSSELNNLGWDVRRGATYQGPWTVITGDIVPGAGNAGGLHEYSYTDTVALPGMHYYQLIQYDLGGARTFSPAVAVYVGTSGIVTPHTGIPNLTSRSLLYDLNGVAVTPGTVLKPGVYLRVRDGGLVKALVVE